VVLGCQSVTMGLTVTINLRRQFARFLSDIREIPYIQYAYGAVKHRHNTWRTLLQGVNVFLSARSIIIVIFG